MVQHVGDNASELHHRIRQHLHGQHRRNPARPAGTRNAGRRQSLFGEPMLNIADLMQTDSDGSA